MFHPTIQMWMRRASKLKSPLKIFLWGLKYILIDTVPYNLVILTFLIGIYGVYDTSSSRREQHARSPIPTEMLVQYLTNKCYKEQATTAMENGGFISNSFHVAVVEKCGIVNLERQNEHLRVLQTGNEPKGIDHE